MPLPDLRPGLVVRYDYLWTREAAAGREQGKDRPPGLFARIKAAFLELAGQGKAGAVRR